MNHLPASPLAHVLSNAFHSRLAECVAERRIAADPAAETLAVLLATLPQLRAAAPTIAQATAAALDENEQQLRTAHAALLTAHASCSPDLVGPPSSALLLDGTQLVAFADRMHQVAQAAAEVALRASARASALTLP